jgi:hypothetical protein
MKNVRADSVIVKIVVTEFNEEGRSIDEVLTQERRIFRATAPDFWEAVDAIVAEVVNVGAKAR